MPVDPNTVIVAAATTISAIGVALIESNRRASNRSRETHERVARLEDLIQTNHGKTPGQYLEMVAEIKTSALLTQGMVEAQGLLLGQHVAKPASVAHPTH